MFWEIFVNNLAVLTIYSCAGLLILKLTRSRLAAVAGWSVFGLHILTLSLDFWLAATTFGLLHSLALTLPHGCLELFGYCLGCVVGTRLVNGKQTGYYAAAAAVIILGAAAIEVWVTPFPLAAWIQ